MELLGKKLAQLSTAGYLDLLVLDIPPYVTKLSIYLKENDVASVKYKILGSMDGVVYGYEITGETGIAQDADTYETPTTNAKLSDPMLHVKVQIIDGGGHGSVSGWVACS
jgi:hypothetical protein